MKKIISKDFKKSLIGLRASRAAYFKAHPTEAWREVKLVSPDKMSWAIVKLKNPSLSPSGLPNR